MEKTKKALEAQRKAFLRIYDVVICMLGQEKYDMLEVQGNMGVLDEKMASITELNQLFFDLLLSSDDHGDSIDAEIQSADKISCGYHKLKLRVEQMCNTTCLDACSSKSSISRHRLRFPLIEFKKFGGDLKDWLPFWSQFRRIDDDSDIEEEDKFQYLLQSTVPNSRARQLVESYPATSQNYQKVINGLKERFGRQDLLVEVYVRELLKLVLNNNNSNKPLSTFYDKVESQLRALETLGVTSDTCAAILYPLVESCLSDDLVRTFHRSSFYTDNSSLNDRLKNLMCFLKKEVESEERITLATSRFENYKPKEKKSYDEIRNSVPTGADLLNNEIKCIFCRDPHFNHQCKKVLEWTLSQKKEVLLENGCCLLCLKFGHVARRCRVKVNCSNCHERHSTIVCPKGENTAGVNFKKPLNAEQSLSNHTYPEVFLQTIVVELKGERESHPARLVFDSGSHRSYVTSSLAEKMGYIAIREEKLIHSLFGGTMSETVEHKCYRIRMKSITEDYSCNFEVLSQPIICNNVSAVRSGPWLSELKNMGISITDTEDGPIDVLVGADINGKLLTGKKESLDCGLDVIHTLLGWTLMGKVKSENAAQTYSSFVINSMLTCDVAISKLWSLDVLGIQDPQECRTSRENEKLVMDHFFATVKRREDGRYEVDMPWIQDHPPLPTNFNLARRREDSVIKKLNIDGFYDDYNQIFEDWLEEEIIEEITVEISKRSGYFLPHHPVIKMSSTTTKIRPVFDATAHERKEPSLNQCLEKGINLIELIPAILIRFRSQKIGVIADIRKAFLQIGLNIKDRDFLKFIWYDKENKLKMFRHARVVFGVTCSPFLLGSVLEYHLRNALLQETYSSANILKLLKAFYVDNVVISVDNEEELYLFMDEAKKILMDGKFDLRG